MRILENLKYVQIGPKLVIRALKLLFKGMENIKKRIRKRQNRKKAWWTSGRIVEYNRNFYGYIVNEVRVMRNQMVYKF